MPKSEITNELLEQVRIARRRRFRRLNWKAGLVLTMARAADGIFVYQNASVRLLTKKVMSPTKQLIAQL